MLPIVLVSAHLLLLFGEIPRAQSVGTPVTCEAGNFTEGESASVTCHFHTSIPASQRSINVVHYATENAKAKDILLCSWSPQDQKHKCITENANYTFDGNLTDRVKLAIHSVSGEQAGQYLCFFLPPDVVDPEVCRLLVKAKQERSSTARPQNTSTDEASEDLNLVEIVVPCAFGLVVVTVIVVVVICVRRRRRQRSDDEQSVPMLPMTSKTIEGHLQPFTLTKTTLQQLVNVMMHEMKKGLDDSSRLEADIKMFPTFLTHLPDGSETGSALVLDFDGKHLQVFMVKLQGHYAQGKHNEYTMPADNKRDNMSDASNELFYFIADRTNSFLKSVEVLRDILPLVFLVAFPCDTARLAKCTTHTTSETSVDRELRNLLEKALTERKKKKRFTPSHYDVLNKLKFVAVVNDAAGTLMSVAHWNCRIALTVGNGFNACFVENCTHPETEDTLEMIVNTELGALGEKGCLEFCRTEFDRELDEQSVYPGTQILEKMVSGRYIGEVVRLALEGLTRKSVLFHTVPLTCALFQRSSLSGEDVIMIENDKEAPHQDTREVQYKPDKEEAYQKTREVLDRLGVINYTDHDVETVRLVCSYVCERAAFLSAAGLAALINHVNQPEVTVVVDGYLYHSHPRFHDLMYSKTQELVTPGLKFYLVSPRRPRLVGAARIAVASLGQHDPHRHQKLSREHPRY